MGILDNISKNNNNDIILLIIVIIIGFVLVMPIIKCWIESSLKKQTLNLKGKKENKSADFETYKLYTEREGRILDVIERSAESNLILAKSVEGLNIRLEQSQKYDVKLESKMDYIIERLSTTGADIVNTQKDIVKNQANIIKLIKED